MSDKKVIGSVTIEILEGNGLSISSTIKDQVAVRDILKTAEEVVIRKCLTMASPKETNIIQIAQIN